jgi:hypothetical protein
LPKSGTRGTDRLDEVAFIGNLERDESASLERGESASLERGEFASLERDEFASLERGEFASLENSRVHALTASDCQLNCQFAPLPALPT